MAKEVGKAPAKAEGKGGVARYGWPGGVFADMQDRMNRMFDDFWHDWPSPTTGGLTQLAPRVDVEEKSKAYVISAELPGLDDKDIEVTVSDDMLTLKGEKKQESEREEKNMHISERSFGSFRRSFRLPPEVATDKISADFNNGVLMISVPKKAEKESPVKKVSIKKAR